VCKKCGWRMAGSTSKDAAYMCAKHTYLGPERCHRRIGAARLEEFTDAAVKLLTHLDVTGAPSAAIALSAADEAAINTDEAELAELKDMWDHRELSTREYRTMRKTVEDHITTLRRKTIVRPTVEVLAGLVGVDARTAWDRLAASGEVERLNAVLWFLFAAVIIDEHRAPRGAFDYSRIEIEPNPL
jgi:site-specific DNA recombinase